MQYIIGTTAGQIWEYLNVNGPSTALKIKSALGIPNSQLHLALGWLSREDKIDISEAGHTFMVALKNEPGSAQ